MEENKIMHATQAPEDQSAPATEEAPVPEERIEEVHAPAEGTEEVHTPLERTEEVHTPVEGTEEVPVPAEGTEERTNEDTVVVGATSPTPTAVYTGAPSPAVADPPAPPVKKKSRKKLALLAGAVVAVAVAVVVIVYFTVLRPNAIYDDAIKALKRGDFFECQQLLEKIPDHNDPEQLRERVRYESARTALESGDYKTAYEIFTELGDYDDAAEQQQIVYYEALAFKSLFNIQPTLKNPLSMRVTKVTFYKDSDTEGELNAIYEITASNSFGGNVGGYVYDLTLFDGHDDSGTINSSDYADPETYVEMLQVMLLQRIREDPVLETHVDISRMNRLLEANVSFDINLPFQPAGVVES